MERRRETELEELEEIRLDLRGIRRDVSDIRRCVEEIWARITEKKTGKMEEREANGGRERCERESGDREKAPRKKDLIEPRPKEEKLNEVGLRSGEDTAAIREMYAKFLADGRWRGRKKDEEGARKDGRSSWTGCKLEDRRGQEREAVEYGCPVDADEARCAEGGMVTI